MAKDTGFAEFDSRGKLQEANQAFLDLIADDNTAHGDVENQDCQVLLARIFNALDLLDGAPVPDLTTDDPASDEAISQLVSRWATAGEGPLEARATDGRWYLLTSYPRSNGVTTFIALDITERKTAELAQHDSDEMLRLITDSHPLPVWVADIETGEILYESLSASNMLGREWKPGRQQSIVDHYARAEDREAVKRLMLDRDSLFDHEVEFKKADGSTVWISSNVRRSTYRGRPVFVSGIADVTMRRLREQELVQARELLIDAIESLSEGFALYDREERLIMCNNRYREMNEPFPQAIETGRTWSEIVMASARAGLFPAAVGREEEWLKEQTQDLKTNRYSREMLQSNGRWYSASRTPTRDGGFVITRIDVTERTQILEAQRQADAVLRQVLDACPATIQMTSATDGRILYRSPATLALFGDAGTSKNYYADPKDRENYIRRLRQTRAVDDFEVDLIRGNGEIMRGSVSSRLIEFQGEEVVVSHTFDLTDRIALQEELNNQRDSLHQSEKLRALGELLAGVAHELNNPLSIVVGQSLLLKETADDEKTRKRAEKIGNAADRCARIVKTFLAMARQQPAHITNAGVNDIVESALEVAGYAIRASNVELNLSLSPDLPVVWCDPDQLN
ncbi:MAG TPA: PAS-domain containing protein, partial [Afifellaceae bacterium]|nr:PAS-domain containing protein [Afifellaceae bacterium]